MNTTDAPQVTVFADWQRYKVLLVGDLEEIRTIVREEINKAIAELAAQVKELK